MSAKRATVSRRVVGAALVAVAAIVGAGGSAAGPAAPSAPRIVVFATGPASTERLAITGGTAGQRRVLRSLAAGLGGHPRITALRLAAPPAGWRAAPRLLAFGKTWLFVDARSSLDAAPEAEAAWQASLVAGAFRDVSHSRGLPALLGFSVIEHRPGLRPDARPSLIAAPYREVKVAGPERLRQLSRRVLGELAGRLRLAGGDRVPGGIVSARLTAVRTIGLAPVVTITARDPLATGRRLDRAFALASDEGILVRIRGLDGLEIGVARAERARIGRMWSPENRFAELRPER